MSVSVPSCLPLGSDDDCPGLSMIPPDVGDLPLFPGCCRTVGESHLAKSKISLVLNPNPARNLVPSARSISPEPPGISSLDCDSVNGVSESCSARQIWLSRSVEVCAPC